MTVNGMSNQMFWAPVDLPESPSGQIREYSCFTQSRVDHLQWVWGSQLQSCKSNLTAVSYELGLLFYERAMFGCCCGSPWLLASATMALDSTNGQMGFLLINPPMCSGKWWGSALFNVEGHPWPDKNASTSTFHFLFLSHSWMQATPSSLLIPLPFIEPLSYTIALHCLPRVTESQWWQHIGQNSHTFKSIVQFDHPTKWRM